MMKSAKTYLATAMLVIVAMSQAYAAALNGIVRDAETSAPVAYASVRIAELNTGAITDDSGTFSFPSVPDGSYTVKVSFTGYALASVAVTVPAASPLEIRLKVTPFIVDETITTARGRETMRSSIPGSVEVVDADEMMESNPVAMSQALARKPGISVSEEMPWGSRAVIRGMTKDQVVLLVDGARVVTATAIPAQFGTIAQGDIERIEVLKGPLSVLYGSGSTGGVVNVITNKGHFTSTPNVGFSISPSYESAANGIAMYERATASTNRFYINVSQSNRKYTDYRAADGERIPNSQFQDRQTQVNFGLKISERHTFEARYQTFSVIDVGIPGGSAFPTKATASYPTTGRDLYDAEWVWRPASRWMNESKLALYYQPVNRDALILPHAPSTVAANPKDEAQQIRTTAQSISSGADHEVYGFRWQNVMRFGSHDVVAGFEGWQKHMESDRSRVIMRETLDKATGSVIGDPTFMVIRDTPVPNSTQSPVGVFAEDAFSLGQRLKITLGGRVDRIHTENDKAYMTYQPKSTALLWDAYTDNDTSWSLVAGGVYNATNALDLNLTLARSFRSPTIEERYLYADLGGILTVGDPDIDSEKGTFIEGGATVRFGDAKFNVQAFMNDITDMVIKKPGGDLKGRAVDYQYANAGEAVLKGVEAGADWAVHPRVLLSADISYIRGTDEKENVDLPAMPPLTGHLSSRLSFGKGFWTEPLLTLVANQNKVAPGERTTPGYGLLSVTAGKSILRTGEVTHSIVLGVKNLTDKQYRDHMTVSRGFDMYGMGRSFYAAWKISGE